MAIGAFYGLPLATLRSHLEAYLAAHLAIAGGQQYSVAGRQLTRANLPYVQETIRSLQQEILRQEGRQKGRVTYADVRSN
jgi:hypothetical protein